MLRLSDADYDILRELERDARPGPSAYTPTDEDYVRWAELYELTLPPLEPGPPPADDETNDLPPW